MAEPSPVIYPSLYAQRDNQDASKYSTPPSTAKTSLYESESPLGAHSSTTSSRLSGSYEPSQVSSIVDELNSDMAQMKMGESATTHHPAHSSQRPYLPGLILPSNMPTPTHHAHRPNTIHAPYSNFHSYPNYFPVAGSPVLREHPTYSYGPIFAATREPVPAPQPSFPSPIHYNSPPPVHAAPYHPDMPRRASVGVYYNYEFGASTPLSPVSPYGYHHHTVSPPMVLMPTPSQPYPASPPLMPAPATRQVRPLVSSPLRPLGAAPSSSSNAAGNRRQAPSLFSSASTFGHQASLLANRAHRRDQRDTQTLPRSGLLSDFKNHKLKRYELKDVFGHCVEFSADQHGSRFIQQQFDHADPAERQVVFEEIVPAHTLPLMKDVFGNYVIQKLFEYSTPLQRDLLCDVMEGNILSLSLDMYGCRVVQKAIDCGSVQQQSAIVAELNGHILQCVKDSNGNHVIQKLLERVTSERMTFIHAFTTNVYNLATHPYGCRVLQRCFEYSSQEQITPLLEELHQNALALMQDQFGNYVVQFVLERGYAADRERLVDAVRGQVLLLSRHKFASNVCEKAIAAADSARKRLIVEEMLAPGSNGVIPVSLMMKDQYANYVLQKAINLVDKDLSDALVAVVLPQLVSMRRHPGSHNSKQLTSIERLLKEKGVGVDSCPPLHLAVSTPVLRDDEPKSGSPTP